METGTREANPPGSAEHATGAKNAALDETGAHLSGMAEQAEAEAEHQKAEGADRIGGLAQAVHGAAHELEPQLPQAAAYIHDAASRLERASTTLRERSVEEILGDLGRLAREQPAMLFGGAVLAGLAFSRFLKSTGNSTRR